MKENKLFLTGEEMKERILKGESMPTSIFGASKKKTYIVKPRGTIFGRYKKKKDTKLLP